MTGGCRYEGQFKNGQRHGYGALHYATGAKYEGEWQAEQKHGRGVFIFEDGTVFDGMFADDQPVLRGVEVWGPVGPGVKLRVQELVEGSDPKQVCPACCCPGIFVLAFLQDRHAQLCCAQHITLKRDARQAICEHRSRALANRQHCWYAWDAVQSNALNFLKSHYPHPLRR